MIAEAGDELDQLVLNAGVNSGVTDLATLDLDWYQTVVGVNQHSVVYALRAALPVLRRNGSGSVVVTASLAALRGIEADLVYTMTKHAVIGLVRAFSGQLAKENIRLSAVCPGLVDTPLTAGARDRFQAAGIPMLSADEVAVAVEQQLESGEPGTDLVVQPGRPSLPYRIAPLP